MRVAWAMAGSVFGMLLLSGASCETSTIVRSPVCEALVACGRPHQACEVFDQVLVSSECADRVLSAPCSDHTADFPSYLDICFPPCTGADPQCVPEGPESVCTGPGSACQSDGTIRTCREVPASDTNASTPEAEERPMRLMVIRCDRACELRGQRFTGICGDSFGEMSSDDERCWCR